MALPQLTDTLRENLGDLIHTAVNCENDGALAAIAPKLDTHHAEIVDRAQARNRADDVVVRRLASRELAFGRLGAALVSWEKAIDAWCDQDRKRYATFFPVTVRKMLGANISDRETSLAPIVEKAKAGGLATELSGGAKKVAAAWAKYQTSVSEVEKAEKGVRKAEADLLAARSKACTFMREVHGRVETAYPDDRALVESFFRKRQVKKVKPAPAQVANGGAVAGAQ